MRVFGGLLFGFLCCGHIAVVLISTAYLPDEPSGWFDVALAVLFSQTGLITVCAAFSSWPSTLRVPAWATIGTMTLATIWTMAVRNADEELLWPIVILASSWILAVGALAIVRLFPSLRWRLVHVHGAPCQRSRGNTRYSLLHLFVVIAAIAVTLSLVVRLFPPSWDTVWDELPSSSIPRSVLPFVFIAGAAVIAAGHVVGAILLLGIRRWPAWLGFVIYGAVMLTMWAYANFESLRGFGTWLTSFVVTLLAARAWGIRLTRERHAAEHAADIPITTTRKRRLISMFQNPAIVALFAVSALYLWLDYSGTFLTCRFLLAGCADQDERGNVVSLNFQDVPAGKLLLAEIGSLRDLTKLNLEGSGISDDELRHISGLSRLEELSLSSTRITDDGLNHLNNLPRLKELHLDSTNVTDDGLHYLRDLSNIEVLSLHSTDITDDGLKCLKNQDKLRGLYLSATAISDGGLEHLHGHGALETLTLVQTQATLVGVCQLAQQLRSLRDVRSDGFAWSPECLYATGGLSAEEIRALAKLNIRELWFDDGHLTQDTCEVLADLHSVEEVCLYEVKGTDLAVKYMKNMPRLKSLVLSGETTGDRAMEHVANLRHLQHLSLSGTAVSDSGFQRLSSLTGLCSLELSGPNVTDAVLPAICKLTKLEGLTFNDTCVRDVSPLVNLSELKELSLWNTSVPGEKIEKLRDVLPDCVIEAY